MLRVTHVGSYFTNTITHFTIFKVYKHTLKKIFAFFKPSKWPIICISGRVVP